MNDRRDRACYPLTVAQQRPELKATRNSLRVIGMVHELHKVGYQRLRVDMGLSPSGVHWRCNIAAAAVEGIEPARYTSASGTEFFGWKDAHHDTARQLTVKFIARFPALCEAGTGLDFANAGWLAWMLGKAENGTLPVFFADYPLEIDPCDMPPTEASA